MFSSPWQAWTPARTGWTDVGTPTVFLSLFLSGCASISDERVVGWPALHVIEHYVPHAIMRDRCSRYVPVFASPEACVQFRFAAGECHIWYSADFPPTDALKRHEQQHCAGYDHLGSTHMQKMANALKE